MVHEIDEGAGGDGLQGAVAAPRPGEAAPDEAGAAGGLPADIASRGPIR